MPGTLTTRGAGSASGAPDAMRVTVAVVVRATAVSEALAGTASGVAAVGEVARRFTSPERIGSTGLTVWPAYDAEGRQSGYECRHTLSLHCDELDRAGDLVGELGGLQDRVLVEGVQPILSDRSGLAVVARERAWLDARRKADELAALADTTVTGVLSIVEETQPVQPYGEEVAAAKLDATRFEAGSQQVVAGLTVTWSLA